MEELACVSGLTLEVGFWTKPALSRLFKSVCYFTKPTACVLYCRTDMTTRELTLRTEISLSEREAYIGT